MKKHLFIFLTMLICISCGQNSGEIETSIAEVEQPKVENNYLSSKASQGSIYQKAGKNSGIHFLADSSMVIWHERPDGSVFKEVGYYSLMEDTLSIYRGQDLEKDSSITFQFEEGLSDSLLVELNTTDGAILGDPKLILYDTLIFSFADNKIVLNKRKVYEALGTNTLWENFDQNFTIDLKIVFDKSYVVLFQPGHFKKVTLSSTKPMQDPPPLKFMIWQKLDDYIVLQKSGLTGVDMDTLELAVTGN